MQNKPFRIQNSGFGIRRGFTLTEMLIVIAIIGIMAGLALSAIAGATEMAREQRTRAVIAKIDQLVMEQFENYRTRAVPIRIPASVTLTAGTQVAARIRLYGLRDLMRMEMPERVTDVVDGPATLYSSGGVTVRLTAPAALNTYRRVALRTCGASWATNWTTDYQGAECLYLILSRIQDGDKNALDFFQSDEIGDYDNDGMKEIWDGWGRPIEFLRWAPGYTKENGRQTDQSSTYTTNAGGYRIVESPDLFDPVRCDPSWLVSGGKLANFGLRPLIISGGRDKTIDIFRIGVDANGNPFRFFLQSPPDDPFFTPSVSGQYQFGTPVDFDGDGLSSDDITNHAPETPQT